MPAVTGSNPTRCVCQTLMIFWRTLRIWLFFVVRGDGGKGPEGSILKYREGGGWYEEQGGRAWGPGWCFPEGREYLFHAPKFSPSSDVLHCLCDWQECRAAAEAAKKEAENKLDSKREQRRRHGIARALHRSPDVEPLSSSISSHDSEVSSHVGDSLLMSA